jgi:hypothetical protein
LAGEGPPPHVGGHVSVWAGFDALAIQLRSLYSLLCQVFHFLLFTRRDLAAHFVHLFLGVFATHALTSGTIMPQIGKSRKHSIGF